jgi:hypothetical protein
MRRSGAIFGGIGDRDESDIGRMYTCSAMWHKAAEVDGGRLSAGSMRALFRLGRSRTIARGFYLPLDGHASTSMSGCGVDGQQLWAAEAIPGPANNGGGRPWRPVQRTKKQAVTS